MKSILSFLMGGSVLLMLATPSQAWFKLGYVYCDSNTNGLLDAADSPVMGVTVGVTNLSGTFATTAVSTPEGSFMVSLPDASDTYVDYIIGSTLPDGTTAVFPAFNQFTHSPDTAVVTNFFRIENPNCVIVPPQTNQWWFHAGGSTGAGRGKPGHTFSGEVHQACKAKEHDGGRWLDLDHNARLEFKGGNITVVAFGQLPGVSQASHPAKASSNYIDFSGTGTLKGMGHNKAKHDNLFFYARIVDGGKPGKHADQYYLRVYDNADNTLLLVSSDPDHPSVIAPVLIRSGEVDIHISNCDKKPK